MKRKHTGKIIAAFVLMYMSISGQAAEELLQMYSNAFGVSAGELPDVGISGAMVFREAHLYSFISLCICSVVMMIVPFIARMMKRKKLSYTSGKQLCMWNSIVLFVLQIAMGIQIVGGVGAVIYYFINKWTFVDD